MKTIAEFNRWLFSCRDGSKYGISDSDTVYLGMRSYDQKYPCPNGLEQRADNPSDVPAMRRRIENAKRDIEAFDGECRVKRIAERVTPRITKAFLSSLRGAYGGR